MFDSTKLAMSNRRAVNCQGVLLDRLPRAVLVVTTLTSASNAPLKRAATWARGFNAKLYVLYVVAPQLRSQRLSPQQHPAEVSEHHQSAEVLQERVQQWVKQLDEPWLPLDQVLIADGNASDQIAAASLAADVDFIVLSLPLAGALGHRDVLNPRNISQIVRMSQRPVLVARSQSLATHILAVTDLVDPAHPALHYATRLADRVGANLTFLHQVDASHDSLLAPPISGMLPSWPPEAVCWSDSAAWNQMLRLAAHFGAEVATILTQEGDGIRRILSEATDRHADLIVVGAHEKRTPLWLHQSVEIELLKQTAASVLVVPRELN